MRTGLAGRGALPPVHLVLECPLADGSHAMDPKTILVPFIGDSASGTALDLACPAASFFDSHVDVLHLTPDARTMIPYVGEGTSAALVEHVLAPAARHRMSAGPGRGV